MVDIKLIILLNYSVMGPNNAQTIRHTSLACLVDFIISGNNPQVTSIFSNLAVIDSSLTESSLKI